MNRPNASVRPKILIVGAFPDPSSKVVGGVLRNCEVLVQSEFSRRYDLSFVDSTQKSNPPPGLIMRAVYAAGRWFRFLQALAANRPDFTMIFCGTGLSLPEKGLMGAVGRLFGAKAVIFPMGGQMIDSGQNDARLQWWYWLCLAPAQILFCQGPMWTTFLEEKLGISPKKFVIVNSWTATPELLAIGEARAYPSGDADWVTVTFIGWIEREKGILDLMEVFPVLARAHRVRLNVIGGGSLEGAVREKAKSAGIEDRVTMHGWVPPSGVADVLRQSDIFVLPTWAEGIPNSLIEAMATKVPAIISRVGTIPDFVVDGESGLLIAPKSLPDLKQALTRMITDADLRLRCAENAFVVAKTQLSIENAIEQMKPAFSKW